MIDTRAPEPRRRPPATLGEMALWVLIPSLGIFNLLFFLGRLAARPLGWLWRVVAGRLGSSER